MLTYLILFYIKEQIYKFWKRSGSDPNPEYGSVSNMDVTQKLILMKLNVLVGLGPRKKRYSFWKDLELIWIYAKTGYMLDNFRSNLPPKLSGECRLIRGFSQPSICPNNPKCVVSLQFP